MKKIVCENENGQTITFTYEYPFILSKLDGVYEYKGDVNTTKSAYSLGENYTNTTLSRRNITINGVIIDNFSERRSTLRKMFPLNSEGTLYYYENEIKRKIKYYVESVDVPERYKGRSKDFIISLICPNPYFTDVEETNVSMANWEGGFEFPLIIPIDTGIEFAVKNVMSMVTVENDTNLEIGMKIVFTATSAVKNPTVINVVTQERITINKIMEAGEKIIVTTYLNDKNIISIINNVEVNINNYLLYGTKYIQIHKGSNTFKAGADEGADNLVTEISYLVNYEAV